MATRRRRPRRARSRPRSRRVGRAHYLPVAVIAGSVVLVLLLAIGITRLVTLPSGAPKTGPIAAACPKVTSVLVGRISVPSGPIAGYCQPNLRNAAEIIRAARSMHLPPRAMEIAVTTAIGESGLRNIEFGDKAGPDSRGLFQQRTNWGPLSARMDPYTAARAFYSRMIGVPKWWSRPVTEVAHAVQGNADPDYYTKFEVRAQLIVGALKARSNLWPWE